MREIKFRAWDKEEKRMVYFNQVTALYEMTRLVGVCSEFVGYMDDCQADLENLVDIELMQYTGLHDKNGLDVYEHDMIKCKEIYRIVLFKHGAFVAVGESGKWILLEYHLLQDEAIKVGNIWEDEKEAKIEHTKKFMSMVISLVGNQSI